MKWRSLKVTEWLAIGLSATAVLVSLLSLYITGLRITDDIRVIAGELPIAEPDFNKKQLLIHAANTQFTFINAGMRNAIISGVTLSVAQPQTGKQWPDIDCRMLPGAFVHYGISPFILKSGDMEEKITKIPHAAAVSVQQKVLSKEDTILVVPFSDANKKSEKVRFKMCVVVTFITPSIEFGRSTVQEFEDELDDSVLGYMTFGEDKYAERRPVQLIRRNGLIFFD